MQYTILYTSKYTKNVFPLLVCDLKSETKLKFVTISYQAMVSIINFLLDISPTTSVGVLFSLVYSI